MCPLLSLNSSRFVAKIELAVHKFTWTAAHTHNACFRLVARHEGEEKRSRRYASTTD